jgi:hypothetical protein
MSDASLISGLVSESAVQYISGLGVVVREGRFAHIDGTVVTISLRPN